ncbi:MAG: WecB/TagA/CpsF family glycosyltransferase [Candidatus Staskawiczbacteria bacterium]|nr:WecB/TagA/CpsF family glycosyltransferase [Candidatus Staskawiczbacteria bacterium]
MKNQLFNLVRSKTTIKNNQKIISGFLAAFLLWLCFWATYNTDIFRIFYVGFPHGFFDLIHGLRSLFPFISLAGAIFILVRNKKFNRDLFKGPVGLLLAYSIIGVVASALSKSPIESLYWGVLYTSVIILLLAVLTGQEASKNLSIIINANWIIAAILSVGLLIFFLIQPGVVHSLTYNFLICSQRPFEGLGNLQKEAQMFGMVGTRPTGLGRYAGIMAIVALASFFQTKKRLKIAWLSAFIIFLSILLFSKGRTEVVAFIVAAIFVIWLAKKINFFSVLGICLISLISVVIIFYNVPCANYLGFLKPAPVSEITPTPDPKKNPDVVASAPVSTIPVETSTVEPATSAFELKNKTIVFTLSGRTSGVWNDAWHLFLSNPLSGYGFQADRIFLNGQHAHDSIIHALIQAGILGTVLFVFAFILAFSLLLKLFKSRQIEEKERNFLAVISAVLVFLAVRSITESVAFFGADWLFVAPMIAYIQCLNDKNVIARGKIGPVKKSILNFLGNKINIITVEETVEKISAWIKNESEKLHWIVVTGMHGAVEAEKHASFKYIISNADMFVPDGISLVWLAGLKGFSAEKRVSGADLMQEFFRVANKEGFSSYFYGDTDETLKELNRKLLTDFPNLKIAGSYSPPFRELTEEEDKNVVERINQAKPDVLWVALGLPKQERWIFKHREKLNVPVVIGVGAAFKFLSGKVKRAPKWIGESGFEWLWRLAREPRVVWKRVFIDGPIFLWLVIKYFSIFDFKKRAYRLSRSIARKILLFTEKNILFPIGILIGPKLLEQLTPYDVKGFEDKVRLGNLCDGGYLLPSKALPLIDVAYSYGVGGDVSFEEDLTKHTNARVMLYDHTEDKLPVENKNFIFKKQGIARKKHGSFNTFRNDLEENGDASKKVILKLDVEGCEWKILDGIINESSKNIVAIVLEIHQLYRYEKILSYIKILKNVNSKFTLAHIHGNNNSESFVFGKNNIPSALELTFINSGLVQDKSIMVNSLPSEKDYPNIKGKNDVVLDFWKK